jgi:AFG3 family protein
LSIRPGFDSFLKRDKNDDAEKDEEKSSVEDEGEKGGESESQDDPVKNGGDGEANEKKEDGDVFGSFRSKYSDNNTRNDSEGGNGGNGIPPNFTGNTILLSLLLVGLSYFLIRNDDDSASPTDFSREITWNDFCNYLLETGQVEKIVVTNNRTIAKVFLKRGSHGLPQHQNRQFRYLDQRRQKGSANQMFNESTTHIQNGYSSGSSDSFDGMQTHLNGKSNQHQIVYRFAIGSVDSFEKKLEEAQKAVGVDPLDEIAVQYTNESTTKSEVLGVLPSLFLMGAAFYFMRFAAGSMGGMGGSGRGGGGMGGERFVLDPTEICFGSCIYFIFKCRIAYSS